MPKYVILVELEAKNAEAAGRYASKNITGKLKIVEIKEAP